MQLLLCQAIRECTFFFFFFLAHMEHLQKLIHMRPQNVSTNSKDWYHTGDTSITKIKEESEIKTI